MSESLRIGELARETGRSIHALRYYESLGLMPFVARDTGGHRRYSAQHVAWVLFLDRLQATGMTLAQMHDYAVLVTQGRTTLARRVALLERHLRHVDEQLALLADGRKLLLAKLRFYEEWRSSGKRPDDSWAAPLQAVAQARRERTRAKPDGKSVR